MVRVDLETTDEAKLGALALLVLQRAQRGPDKADFTAAFKPFVEVIKFNARQAELEFLASKHAHDEGRALMLLKRANEIATGKEAAIMALQIKLAALQGEG